MLAVLVMTAMGFTPYFAPLASDSARAMFAPAAASAAVIAGGLSGRLVFGLSAVALLLTVLGVVVTTRAVVGAVLERCWPRLRRAVLALTFGGAAVVLAGSLVTQHADARPDLLGVLFDRAGIAPNWPITFLVRLANAVTPMATVLLTVSFSLLSAPVADGDRRFADLAGRLRLLRALLYLASACFVSRVVQVYALYAWSASQLDPAAAAEGIALLTSAAVGVIYSLFLASLYIPAATMLSNRLREAKVDEAESVRARPTTPADGQPAAPAPLPSKQILELHGAERRLASGSGESDGHDVSPSGRPAAGPRPRTHAEGRQRHRSLASHGLATRIFIGNGCVFVSNFAPTACQVPPYACQTRPREAAPPARRWSGAPGRPSARRGPHWTDRPRSADLGRWCAGAFALVQHEAIAVDWISLAIRDADPDLVADERRSDVRRTDCERIRRCYAATKQLRHSLVDLIVRLLVPTQS